MTRGASAPPAGGRSAPETPRWPEPLRPAGRFRFHLRADRTMPARYPASSDAMIPTILPIDPYFMEQ
ncbi:hypothetical protein C7S14_5768 [Burkholderia cepacia]|nr:hypothetical protein C7S14_5768 [Burkholderia cepacia]